MKARPVLAMLAAAATCATFGGGVLAATPRGGGRSSSSSSSVLTIGRLVWMTAGKIHQEGPPPGTTGRALGHSKDDPLPGEVPAPEDMGDGEEGSSSPPPPPAPASPPSTSTEAPTSPSKGGVGTEPDKVENPEDPSPEVEAEDDGGEGGTDKDEDPEESGSDEAEGEAPVPEGSPPSDDKNRTAGDDGKSPGHIHSGDASADEEDPDSPTASDSNATAAGGGDSCAALERLAVRGRVQYVAEVAASTEEDALVLGQDVNDLVVSHLSDNLPAADCQQRRRRLSVGRRTATTDNQFLSFEAAGTTVNAAESCTALTTKESCYTVVSNVKFSAVPGDSEEAPNAQVVESIPSAFSNLSPKSVQFVEAHSNSGGAPELSSVAAASSGQSSGASSGGGSAPKVAAIALGTLVAAAVVGLLYVRRERRRRRAFQAEIDKVENTLDLSDSVDSSSPGGDLAYVCGDDADTLAHPVTPMERLLSKLRLSRSGESVPPPPPLPAVLANAHDDAAIEVLHRERVLPDAARKHHSFRSQYSGTARSRTGGAPNTVDL